MKRLYILFLLVSLTGCIEDPDRVPGEEVATASDTELVFEEAKWKTKEGQDYPFRNEMLEDLMNREDLVNDHSLRDLKRDEILELLGEPDRVDTNYLFYRVEQKRLGLWPLHTKTMVIELAQDSTVNWVKIHE